MSYAPRFVNKIDAGTIVAALLTLFVVQALLQAGLPTSADLAIHLHRTMEFERAWAEGVFVPRWAPNLAYGYGYPLFIFAPPLPYVLGMGLHLVGLSIGISFKVLIMLAMLLYATGMYLLVRDLFASPAAGLVAAVAYAFAPFALREALLDGGNVPQLLAIGLFPWPLWAVARAIVLKSWGWTMLAALFYAAIILSHLFQAFIFSMVFGLYIALLMAIDLVKRFKPAGVNQRPVKPRLDRLLFVMPLSSPIIGLLLSAFFLLPAFTERLNTRAQADIYLEKSPFFVRYPHWTELVAWIHPLDYRAANPHTPLTLGLVTLILATAGLLTTIIVSSRRATRPCQAGARGSVRGPNKRLKAPLLGRVNLLMPTFFALVAVTAGLMSLSVSRPIWESIDILQVAEFPWRMLGLANLGLAVVAGFSILAIPLKVRPIATALCITIQLFAIAPYLYPVIPFTNYGRLSIADQIRYERSSQSIGTTTLGEYLPQSVTRPPTTSPLVELFEAGAFPERLDRMNLPDEASATLIEQTAVTHRYRLRTATAFTMRLFQFDFPGWRASLNGQPAAITPESETGLILVDIPAGDHELTIRFGETPSRIVAMSVTGLTVIALIAATIVSIKRGPSTQLFERSQLLRPVEAPDRLLLNSPAVMVAMVAIVTAAFGLKPLLQPVFTAASPRGMVIAAQHQANIRFANGIQLIGYDLKRSTVQAGDYLQVVLYWQADGAPYRVNLQPFVHLDQLDDFSTVADATNYTPGDVTTETNLPTFHWDNLRYIRDEHDLMVPTDTPPLAYAVRIGLIDPDKGGQLVPLADGSGDTARIDTINVSSAHQRPLILAQPLDLIFSHQGDTIHLTGFELTDLTSSRLEFSLAWESDQRPSLDYTIFAQLLDADNNLATSFDGPPLDGAYPTSLWLPNQSIVDPRILPLNKISRGTYTLIAGLYDGATGQRMTTSGGADFVELSTITIQ